MPVTKEPNGLDLANNKRPDGLTLLPWKGGRPLTWDVTVTFPLADSYIEGYVAGSAAERAATSKRDKYTSLPGTLSFEPIAFESTGAINESAITLLSELGRRISERSNEDRETTFLFQRLSVTLQRYNSILLQQSFVTSDDPSK
jgi:hypothetical protein